MWPFQAPPIEAIRQVSGREAGPDFLDPVRLAVARVNDSGSGSFVSRDGLLLTNHHVVADVLDKLSTKQRDLIVAGFKAQTRGEEMKVPVEVLVTVSMEDVTARVVAAMARGSGAAEIVALKDEAVAKIEKESRDATGLRSEVSRHDDQFWLYRYKEHADVRLVFAPPVQAAYFGWNDPAQQEPGHWLDMVFLRVYGENGEPAATPHFLPFRLDEAPEKTPVFAAGFPYKTQRHLSEAQLKLEKGLLAKVSAEKNAALLSAYQAYAELGEDQAREVRRAVWDARDFTTDQDAPALDPVLRDKARARDLELRRWIAASPERKARYGGLLKDIARTSAEKERRYAAYSHRRLPEQSKLAGFAMELARFALETEKPERDRAEGYAGPELEAKRQKLAREEQVSPDLEERLLDASLALTRRALGKNDAFVRAAFQGRTPSALARELAKKTNLADPAYRKALAEGGARAIRASTDPFIRLALRIAPLVGEMDRWHEEKIAPAEERQNYLMSKARAERLGRSRTPDAAWALRLSFGRILGYSDTDGSAVPARSDFAGLYRSSDERGDAMPFKLDPELRAGRSTVDPDKPVNLQTTADIAGGNSGGPLFDADRRLVGLIYATNKHSSDEYDYDSKRGRSIAVDSVGILEALRNAYQMNNLVNEIARDAAQSLVRRPMPRPTPSIPPG